MSRLMKIWHIFAATVICIEFSLCVIYPYKKCQDTSWPRTIPKIDIYVKNGKCTQRRNCEALVGCTTFEGNVIVRESFNPKANTTIPASFPALREITGYLVIFHVKTDLGSLENLFPNLAVIRGTYQIVHYSLVIYGTFFENVGLPSLTVIKSGGVRLDHNKQMCYIQTVKWRSIVLDKAYTEENFGISFYRNNENCYDQCLENHCIAPSGHDSTRQQYCFGPGNKTNAQCQKLCQASCGPQGCVDGTTNQCCHKDCLGGCTVKASNRHCHACMNYRAGGMNGTCVSKCPEGNYVVNDFECQKGCPSWGRFWPFIPEEKRYYAFDGKCVKQCPSGYTKNVATKLCDKCKTSLCPKVCRNNGEYKIDGISTMKGLKDCTVFNSSIVLEIRAGPSNIMEELEKNLGSLQHVQGYIKVSESEVLTSLNFFKNLEKIGTNHKNPYSLMVLSNPNLKSLWKPKKLTVRYGNILLHGNMKLCPAEIKSFNKTLNTTARNIGALTQAQNGFLCPGDLDRFNITVFEVTCKNPARDGKCVNVSWLHKSSFDSRSVFYIVNYKIKKWTVGEKVIQENNCSTRWCQVDVSIPDLRTNSSRLGDVEMVEQITHLIPFTTYTFFVETYLIKSGDGRKSYQLDYHLPEGIPGIPVGLKTAYLSASAIEVSWNPPESPNGVITEYRIYYEKKKYSFWNSGLDWCSRHLSSSEEEINGNKNATTGSCPRNVTLECEVKEKESRRVLEDRNFVLFNSKFEDELITNVFQKVEKENTGDKLTTKRPSTCTSNSNETNCNQTTASVATQTPTKMAARTTAKPTTTTPSHKPSVAPTRPIAYKQVDGQTLKYVIKDLSYFQEYIIKVCPCNRAGCLDVGHCPDVFGQTDAIPSADMIPGGVGVNVKGDIYAVNWTAPTQPNGVILLYDIRTRHNQNQEKRRCLLGSMPTEFVERGAAPGNYSLRIKVITPAGNATWTTPVQFTIKEKSAQTEDYNAVVVGVGTTAAVVIILLASFLYYVRAKKSGAMPVPGVLYASSNPDYLDSSDVYVPDEWEVPREKVQLVRELGKGSFGKVFEGIAHRIIEGEPKLRVAVKTVNEGASIKDRIEFLQEASIMKAFNCHHIVKLLGVVSQGEPTLVVMELMERGDLKGFLRGRRPDTESELLPPSLAELLQMAAEIADGMSYLAARKFVHRDLAARNCMVAADFTVKIGDFGMTRDVYDTDYYRKGGKGLLPVRWMAPESLYDGVFTSASDVWSYGIVLWEMATLAAQPYPGKSNEDVLSFVIEGGILEQPEACSDRLYNMMCNCWKPEPRARPSFLEIVHFLEFDVSESFEEVSYYHEMKRRLLEATDSDMTPVQEPLNQGRRGLTEVAGTSSCNMKNDENWMTEADRGMGCQGETCQGIENDMYSSSEKDVRYVEFPM
ncbi:putative insulin-like peptide receptor isoform X1 [Rhopilema esculentum]